MISGRWLPVLVMTALFGALVMLGVWQWGKGAAKSALTALAAQSAAEPQKALNACPQAESEHGRAIAEGHYLAAGQVLVDNRFYGGAPGYEVVTPLQLASGEVLAVNRGWVPLGDDRATPPRIAVPGGSQSIAGVLRLPTHNPLLPRSAVEVAGGVRRVPELYPQDLVGAGARACALVLLMDPGVPDGFARDWPVTVMSPQRHYAYAAQWFAMAGAVLILGAWMWRRP